ncbi:hypothetical protein Tco_1004450 [Tanacetum coccineum]|uniref:Uncharacterized protein n=1 Tax=Tanacetum coccineum TaxID=301880 RepID=A0ABQ5FCF1_9ASTR
MWLAVVPAEDETMDLELLSVKYPIVDWESQNLGSVDMEDIHISSFNMLVEKIYHLIKEILKKMLNWKLEVEAESTMAFELLKFIKSQFRGGLMGIMDFYNLVLLIQLNTAGDDDDDGSSSSIGKNSDGDDDVDADVSDGEVTGKDDSGAFSGLNELEAALSIKYDK